MQGLTPGRKVHYVLPEKHPYLTPGVAGEIRPMEVVKVYDKEAGVVNGHVALDGTNDSTITTRARGIATHSTSATSSIMSGPIEMDYPMLLMWVPSVPYSEGHEPGTWHWIPRA